MRSVQKSDQNQKDATGQEKTCGRAAVREQIVLHSAAFCRGKMPGQSQQENQRGKQREESAEIGKYARPADGGKRAVSKPHIMNEKNTDGKQPATEQKQPGPPSLGLLGKPNPGLQEGQHERQVPEINHVDMRIHLGAPVFQKAAEVLKDCRNAASISREGR